MTDPTAPATAHRTVDPAGQEYQLVNAADLRPHPSNPNEGDVGAIATSIDRNGWYGAVVVQRSTGYILAGNHRWHAAQQLGHTQVPAIFVDVDEDTALRILLADNRTTRLGRDDDDMLVHLLQHLAETDGGLDGTGFDDDDLDKLLADAQHNAGPTDDAKLKVTVTCDNADHQALVTALLDAHGITYKAS